MSIRKFSLLFFIFSIIAGAVGALAGEWLIATYYGIWPNLLLVGAYFGLLALIAGLFCLLAELLSPVINGYSWRLEYSGFSWKMLVPATLVMLFAAGLMFQFFYSIYVSKEKPPDDMVVVLDISGSMKKTDPNRESIKAAGKLINSMKPVHRAAIVSFNDQAFITKPLFSISDKTERADAITEMNRLKPDGGTNIGRALNTAMEQINLNQQPDRKPMVILFSDGYSELDLHVVVKPYQEQGIVINTIGMSKYDWDGAQLLKRIASRTGGSFHDVKNAADLSRVFEKIYLDNQDRLLVAERYGVFQNSIYLAILRIVLVILIGGLFGLSLGIIFDNRYLAKSYSISGLISGLLAGLVLEIGSQSTMLPGLSYRMTAAILLTVVTGLGTILIPVRDKYSGDWPRRSGGADTSTRNTTTIHNGARKGF